MGGFDVVGRLRLVRRTLWADGGEGDGHSWFVTFAVVGMAGAVSLHVRFFDQGIVEGTNGAGTAAFKAEGICVHAYRPIPNATKPEVQEKCPLLDGRRCHSHSVDWPGFVDSRRLLAKLVLPDGLAKVWDGLERVYWQEFVPVEPASQILARERLLGVQLAEARVAGEPEFVAGTGP